MKYDNYLGGGGAILELAMGVDINSDGTPVRLGEVPTLFSVKGKGRDLQT